MNLMLAPIYLVLMGNSVLSQHAKLYFRLSPFSQNERYLVQNVSNAFWANILNLQYNFYHKGTRSQPWAKNKVMCVQKSLNWLFSAFTSAACDFN